MNSSYIQSKLSGLFSNYDYRLLNTYVFGWESDFFAISKSRYSIEIEVKISRSDFFADFKKTHFSGKNKHFILNDKMSTNKPNKFFFACPEGLIKPDEINANYGLIYVDNGQATTIREAKFLHKTKILENKHYLRSLLDKFYYRNIELRRHSGLREWDIKHGQTTHDLFRY